MFIDKFSVALSFQNLKNVDINILECEIYFNIFIKISQFELLVTTGQRVLVYKLFLSLSIADFSFFFSSKNCNPPEKKSPSPLSQQPGSKNRGPVELPSFGKFGRIITPPPLPSRKGGCTLWCVQLL